MYSKMNRVTMLSVITGLLLVFSCNRNSQQLEDETSTSKEVIIDTVSDQKDSPVSQRFVSLVQYIDSMGYTFDTLRYTPHKNFTTLRINDYIFFEVEKESTISFSSIDTHPFSSELTGFSSQPFDSAIYITKYYFKQKNPRIVDGIKWYIDGIIEEWTFENNIQAENAVNTLINTELSILC